MALTLQSLTTGTNEQLRMLFSVRTLSSRSDDQGELFYWNVGPFGGGGSLTLDPASDSHWDDLRNPPRYTIYSNPSPSRLRIEVGAPNVGDDPDDVYPDLNNAPTANVAIESGGHVYLNLNIPATRATSSSMTWEQLTANFPDRLDANARVLLVIADAGSVQIPPTADDIPADVNLGALQVASGLVNPRTRAIATDIDLGDLSVTSNITSKQTHDIDIDVNLGALSLTSSLTAKQTHDIDTDVNLEALSVTSNLTARSPFGLSTLTTGTNELWRGYTTDRYQNPIVEQEGGLLVYRISAVSGESGPLTLVNDSQNTSYRSIGASSNTRIFRAVIPPGESTATGLVSSGPWRSADPPFDTEPYNANRGFHGFSGLLSGSQAGATYVFVIADEGSVRLVTTHDIGTDVNLPAPIVTARLHSAPISTLTAGDVHDGLDALETGSNLRVSNNPLSFTRLTGGRHEIYRGIIHPPTGSAFSTQRILWNPTNGEQFLAPRSREVDSIVYDSSGGIQFDYAADSPVSRAIRDLEIGRNIQLEATFVARDATGRDLFNQASPADGDRTTSIRFDFSEDPATHIGTSQPVRSPDRQIYIVIAQKGTVTDKPRIFIPADRSDRSTRFHLVEINGMQVLAVAPENIQPFVAPPPVAGFFSSSAFLGPVVIPDLSVENTGRGGDITRLTESDRDFFRILVSTIHESDGVLWADTPFDRVGAVDDRSNFQWRSGRSIQRVRFAGGAFRFDTARSSGAEGSDAFAIVSPTLALHVVRVYNDGTHSWDVLRGFETDDSDDDGDIDFSTIFWTPSPSLDFTDVAAVLFVGNLPDAVNESDQYAGARRS